MDNICCLFMLLMQFINNIRARACVWAKVKNVEVVNERVILSRKWDKFVM
jgi:hypothetical protein